MKITGQKLLRPPNECICVAIPNDYSLTGQGNPKIGVLRLRHLNSSSIEGLGEAIKVNELEMVGPLPRDDGEAWISPHWKWHIYSH